MKLNESWKFVQIALKNPLISFSVTTTTWFLLLAKAELFNWRDVLVWLFLGSMVAMVAGLVFFVLISTALVVDEVSEESIKVRVSWGLGAAMLAGAVCLVIRTGQAYPDIGNQQEGGFAHLLAHAGNIAFAAALAIQGGAILKISGLVKS